MPDTHAKAKFPPSLDDLALIAEEALGQLPELFLQQVQGIALSVEEFADEETLAELGIEDPFALTGLYHGLPIGAKDAGAVVHAPDRIVLYRRAILDEWIADGEDLEHLVRHVLIHEIGHHLGLSDDDLERIEDEQD